MPEVFTQRASLSHSSSDCALSQTHRPPPLTALLALLGLWGPRFDVSQSYHIRLGHRAGCQHLSIFKGLPVSSPKARCMQASLPWMTPPPPTQGSPSLRLRSRLGRADSDCPTLHAQASSIGT